MGRKEFEKWQIRLRSREKTTSKLAGAVTCCQTLSDSKDFSEHDWRSMGRCPSESARAYEFRTGVLVETERRERNRSADQSPINNVRNKEAKSKELTLTKQKRSAGQMSIEDAFTKKKVAKSKPLVQKGR